MFLKKLLLTLYVMCAMPALFAEKPPEALGLSLEGYAYPYPVKFMDLKIENTPIKMAYMDIAPVKEAQNQTIVLLHGGLSFGAYWKDTISFLSEQGFRVIVPDQIGYGKSSKENIHYSFNLLAKNTNELLGKLEVKEVILVGHSLGGMLATRFALMYPEKVNKLVLEDSLGLEDYRLKIPYKSIDEMYSASLHPTWESILNTHKGLYAKWDERYGEYAQATYRISLNPQYPKVALVNAILYEMLYTQPVVYELEYLKMPTLLLYGDQDHVAPGKGFADKETQKTLGNYPMLVKSAAAKIPHAQIKSFADVGHVPHLEVTKEFNQTLLEFVKQPEAKSIYQQ